MEGRACLQFKYQLCRAMIRIMKLICNADSGTTLDAQARYSAGVKEILRRTFDGEELNPTDVIVQVRLSSCFDVIRN